MCAVEEQTEFTFEELSDRAKDKAREAYRGEGYLSYEWWDSTYEDFIECAKRLGFTTDREHIWFSGFSSQGDGACFKGMYSGTKCTITEYAPRDEVLADIAKQLDALNVAAFMQHEVGATWNCRIYTSGGYCHSGTMCIDETDLDPYSDDLLDTPSIDHAEEVILGAARTLADWLYARLGEEYDYLMSDECVDQYLTDGMKFDEDGATI